jgi:hypothetical protein
MDPPARVGLTKATARLFGGAAKVSVVRANTRTEEINIVTQERRRQKTGRPVHTVAGNEALFMCNAFAVSTRVL